jgi:hypothetical protein
MLAARQWKGEIAMAMITKKSMGIRVTIQVPDHKFQDVMDMIALVNSRLRTAGHSPMELVSISKVKE